MCAAAILSRDEINDLIDDITRIFMHDVMTGSLILSIAYKALMSARTGLLQELKENTEKRADFVEDICQQIEMSEVVNPT